MGSNRNKYTAYDDEVIVEMYDAGRPWKEISEKLGRSVSSLQFRLYQQIREGNKVAEKVYNRIEDGLILDWRRKSITYPDIAELTGRTTVSLKRRVKLLKKIAAREKAEKEYARPDTEGQQTELFLIDCRESDWLAVMKGREYEDEPEYQDAAVMRADILAEQRHTTPYGF